MAKPTGVNARQRPRLQFGQTRDGFWVIQGIPKGYPCLRTVLPMVPFYTEGVASPGFAYGY